MLNRVFIEERLIFIGMKPRLKGFKYITDAIIILDTNKFNKWSDIYSKISVINYVSPESVERSIRTAIDSTRNNLENYDIVDKYFGYTNCENSSTLIMFYKTLCQEHNSYIDIELLEEKCIATIKEIFSSFLCI